MSIPDIKDLGNKEITKSQTNNNTSGQSGGVNLIRGSVPTTYGNTGISGMRKINEGTEILEDLTDLTKPGKN